MHSLAHSGYFSFY